VELVAGYIGVSPGELDPMDHVIELSPVDDHAFLPGLTWLAPFGDKPGAGDQVPGDPGLLPKELDHVEAMGNVDWAEAAVQIGTAIVIDLEPVAVGRGASALASRGEYRPVVLDEVQQIDQCQPGVASPHGFIRHRPRQTGIPRSRACPSPPPWLGAT
jgi:hypothetical protein